MNLDELTKELRNANHVSAILHTRRCVRQAWIGGIALGAVTALLWVGFALWIT